MKVILQVDKHVVSVETDFKPVEGGMLFKHLFEEVTKKMEFVLDKEGGAE